MSRVNVQNTHLLVNMHETCIYCGFNLSNSSYWDPSYKHEITLVSAWTSKYIHFNVWDETTYPFSNFNNATVEFGEWISNLITRLTVCVIIYPC